MELIGNISAILQSKGPQVWSIAPEAKVFEAIQMMADKNIGALLVVENSKLIGILSERDYTRKVALRGKSSRETPVRDIITTPVIIATARTRPLTIIASSISTPPANPGESKVIREPIQ